MLWLDFAAILFSIGYCSIQLRFVSAWKHLPVAKNEVEKRRWSILIPARNEAAKFRKTNGPSIFQTLDPAFQSYADTYEVIVIDDHSDDQTAELASEYPFVTVLKLPDGLSGKKAALTFGIAQASGDWIATLDADVLVGNAWLTELTAFSRGHQAVAGPVEISENGSWFERWQSLDFCGMMLITGASLRIGNWAMGNGANLAFAKTAFDFVGGYESPPGKTSASGDDMVLLAKFVARFPERVTFAKSSEAVVVTQPQRSIGAFIQQRWRWSAKTGLNQQALLTATLAWVWAFHLGLVLGPVLAALGFISWSVLALGWLVKLQVDFQLLNRATEFFDRKHLLGWSYPIDSLVHAIYVAGIGLLALLPVDFTWKGRKHRA